jgi:hypothetical protein
VGIEVARSKQSIFISQGKYVVNLLKETRMLSYKTCDTPIEQNHKLDEDQRDVLADKGRYIPMLSWKIDLSVTHSFGYCLFCHCG